MIAALLGAGAALALVAGARTVGVGSVAGPVARGEVGAPAADVVDARGGSEAETAAAGSADEPAELAARAELPAHVRWIAVGGGAEPDTNQISLEDDLLLVREVLGEGGVLLFAGGPGTRSVQVRDESDRGEPLRRMLGELFASRAGRQARYLPTRLALHGPATLAAVEEVLGAALADGDEPLLLWVAAHGDRGQVPADSVALLWAGDELRPADIERIVRESGARRPLRMVITSCYAGGFAELAFRALDPGLGPTDLPVCGLFATSWDEEASGCDPNPDRAAHEGYAIRLLEALRGRDREGRDIRAEIDLDGDGTIDLLEAHARARIDALSFDLPTSTSSRLLRAIAPSEGRSASVDLPDERAVVRALGERLRIADVHDAQARLDEIARRRVELEALRDERRAETDDLWWTIVGELLSRWPVIDDPWHPDFESTLAREGRAIRALLDGSVAYAAWRQAQEDLEAIEATLAAMRVEAAPLRRWLEAHETIELAGRLRARGGPAWERWQRMRACEGGRL